METRYTDHAQTTLIQNILVLILAFLYTAINQHYVSARVLYRRTKFKFVSAHCAGFSQTPMGQRKASYGKPKGTSV